MSFATPENGQSRREKRTEVVEKKQRAFGVCKLGIFYCPRSTQSYENFLPGNNLEKQFKKKKKQKSRTF